MEFDQYCSGLLFWIRYPVFVLLHSLFIRFFVLFCFLIRFVRLFSVRLFVYTVLFSVLILELYSRYFDPVNRHLERSNLLPSSTF
jgi:hypothetical protein